MGASKKPVAGRDVHVFLGDRPMSIRFNLPMRILDAFSPVRLAIAGGVAIAGVTLLGSLATAGDKPHDQARAATALCGERTAIIGTLSSDFAESPSSSGITDAGALVELFTSLRGSWTIIATRPDGVSCLVASGADWRTAPHLRRWHPI